MTRRSSYRGVATVLALIWALIVLLSQPASAQTGPEAAQRDAARVALLRTIAATHQCMRSAVHAALRNGVTDDTQLATFARSMCGLPLYSFLKLGGGFTDAEIQTLINTMAAKVVVTLNN